MPDKIRRVKFTYAGDESEWIGGTSHIYHITGLEDIELDEESFILPIHIVGENSFKKFAKLKHSALTRLLKEECLICNVCKAEVRKTEITVIYTKFKDPYGRDIINFECPVCKKETYALDEVLVKKDEKKL